MIFNVGAGGAAAAEQIKYDNSKSGLESDNVQGAVDELNDSLVPLLTNDNYIRLNKSVEPNSSYTVPESGLYFLSTRSDGETAAIWYIDSGRTKDILSSGSGTTGNNASNIATVPLKEGTVIYTRNKSNTAYAVKGYVSIK